MESPPGFLVEKSRKPNIKPVCANKNQKLDSGTRLHVKKVDTESIGSLSALSVPPPVIKLLTYNFKINIWV